MRMKKMTPKSNKELTLNQLFRKRDYIVRLIEDCGYDLEAELDNVHNELKDRIIELRMVK